MLTLGLPGFGWDTSKVSGFTEPGHEVNARLFLPLARQGAQQYVPWRVASEQVGLSFGALTTWDELVRAADGDPAWEIPRGTVDDATARALTGALARPSTDGAAVSAWFALWEGYAGEIDTSLHDATTPIPATGQNFLCDGSYRLLTAPLGWALTRTDQQRLHFPVAVWPADRSFVLASAIYQDSFYLSCSRETFTVVRAAGLELLEIDPDMPLPSRGD